MLSLLAMEAALHCFDGCGSPSPGHVAVADELFIELVDAHLCPGVEVPSPREQGGAAVQVSLRPPGAYAVVQALIARGVIGDYREPDIVRLGFAPLYVTHADCVTAAGHLAAVLAAGEHEDGRYAARAMVTDRGRAATGQAVPR